MSNVKKDLLFNTHGTSSQPEEEALPAYGPAHPVPAYSQPLLADPGQASTGQNNAFVYPPQPAHPVQYDPTADKHVRRLRKFRCCGLSIGGVVLVVLIVVGVVLGVYHNVIFGAIQGNYQWPSNSNLQPQNEFESPFPMIPEGSYPSYPLQSPISVSGISAVSVSVQGSISAGFVLTSHNLNNSNVLLTYHYHLSDQSLLSQVSATVNTQGTLSLLVQAPTATASQSYFVAVEVQLPQVLSSALNISLTCASGTISIVNLHPTQALGLVQIQAASADVAVSNVVTAASSNITLQTTSGNLALQNSNISALSVVSTSGNVGLTAVVSTLLDISTNSGSIQTTGSSASQHAGFTTTSGRFSGDISIGSQLKQSSTSGDVSLGVSLTGTISTAYSLDFHSTSGDISPRFSGPIVGSIDITTNSGSVQVSGSSVVLSPSTGSKEVTGQVGGSTSPSHLTVSTTSGDVNVQFS
ncbi:uncharacterized protein BJ171DRAFT_598220 [Polychytrium aggregatum]|uniref:uncharacterized protein n=1 Tax=Polychytrium aggregatum TaxID=110093 RepID=UPI0022FF0A71|nr:uncharacterized protein BJ171DRAFT_598220 [Polychytrium aggregatum]KAI9205543.1 hypothetical protein BJ171DRAFT_598220 [Polychytrium aggregatum]